MTTDVIYRKSGNNRNESEQKYQYDQQRETSDSSKSVQAYQTHEQ